MLDKNILIYCDCGNQRSASVVAAYMIKTFNITCDKAIENIRLKLIDNLKLKSLKIIDNTSLHKKHKFFSKEKLHLKLIINSPELKAKNSAAQRKRLKKSN